MRKLPPLQAIGHALNSVVNYAGMAVGFGRYWVPILFLLGLIEWQFTPPPPADPAADWESFWASLTFEVGTREALSAR